MNPKISMKTKVHYADSLDGARTQIGYVQNIPQLKPLKEGKAYSSLELDEERMAKGTRKAEALDITILFTHDQHNTLKSIADSNAEKYFFFEFPEETAQNAGSPLVIYFKASIDIANEPIEIDDFLKDTIRMFKSTDVLESDGFPAEQSA